MQIGRVEAGATGDVRGREEHGTINAMFSQQCWTCNGYGQVFPHSPNVKGKDMSNEFQVWRQPRGTAGNIILKSDGEPAIPPAKYHGGIVVQERPAVVKANRMDLSRSRENGQGVCVR